MKGIYKRKGIKSLILWEKIYYQNDIIDESHDSQGKETKKWSGIIFLFRFLILKGSLKNRLLIEPLITEYGGNNKQEMINDLKEKVKGLKEWKLKGKHWKNADFFPKEVNKQLLKFNLEKYAKKLS